MTKPTKEQLRESQARLRARRKELGFKRIDFWVHEDDWGRVKQYENKLYNKKMRELGETP